jgi:hypothetical protein
MKTYRIIRGSATDNASQQAVRIWDGESLLWERPGDTYTEHDGKMVQLSTLTDEEIIALYRKDHE